MDTTQDKQTLFQDLFGSDEEEEEDEEEQQQQQQQTHAAAVPAGSAEEDGGLYDEEDSDDDRDLDMQRSYGIESRTAAAVATTTATTAAADIVDDDDDDVDHYRHRHDDVDEYSGSTAQRADLPPLEDRFLSVAPNPSIAVDARVHYARLPNVLSVESHPYSLEQLRAERARYTMATENGMEQHLQTSPLLLEKRRKLFEGNVMRWRMATNGGSVESNTRLVRWDDGSYQLHIGDEVYDVSQGSFNGELNHLFVASADVFSCQGRFHKKLSFKPHSTRSMAHQTVNRILRHKERRKRTLITHVVREEEDERRARETQREKSRMEAQQRAAERETVGRVSLTSDFLEEEGSGGGAGDIGAIKRTYRRPTVGSTASATSAATRRGTSSSRKRTRSRSNYYDSDESSGPDSDDDHYYR